MLPLSTVTYQGSASAKSHWSTPGPGAFEVSRPWLTKRNSANIVSWSLSGGPTFSPKTRLRTSVWPSCTRSSGGMPGTNTGGPGSSLSGMPALRILVSNEVTPSRPISSSVKPKHST